MRYEKTIQRILEQDPAARNSDKYLWMKLAETLYIDLGRPFREVVWDMPSYESVGRIRRKLQEKHEELRAEYDVRKSRKVLEQEYREWALST